MVGKPRLAGNEDVSTSTCAMPRGTSVNRNRPTLSVLAPMPALITLTDRPTTGAPCPSKMVPEIEVLIASVAVLLRTPAALPIATLLVAAPYGTMKLIEVALVETICPNVEPSLTEASASEVGNCEPVIVTTCPA